MELKNLPPVTIYVRTENAQFAAHRSAVSLRTVVFRPSHIKGESNDYTR